MRITPHRTRQIQKGRKLIIKTLSDKNTMEI